MTTSLPIRAFRRQSLSRVPIELNRFGRMLLSKKFVRISSAWGIPLIESNSSKGESKLRGELYARDLPRNALGSSYRLWRIRSLGCGGQREGHYAQANFRTSWQSPK